MNKQTLPMPVRVKPYAHQQAAFDFVCDLFGLTTFEEASSGAALLMKMGTGKSLVGLAVAGILSRFSLIERVLVVCPLSIMSVWEEELSKYADFPYSVTLLKGTMAKKKEQLANLPRSELQIVVTNYETMWRMEEELQRYHAGLIIADWKSHETTIPEDLCYLYGTYLEDYLYEWRFSSTLPCAAGKSVCPTTPYP